MAPAHDALSAARVLPLRAGAGLISRLEFRPFFIALSRPRRGLPLARLRPRQRQRHGAFGGTWGARCRTGSLTHVKSPNGRHQDARLTSEGFRCGARLFHHGRILLICVVHLQYAAVHLGDTFATPVCHFGRPWTPLHSKPGALVSRAGTPKISALRAHVHLRSRWV